MKSLLVVAVTGSLLAAALAPLGCSNDTAPVTVNGTGRAGGGGPGDLGPGDPGPGGVRFAASGEVLALTGYAFPPASADDPVFVDGWEVRFTHLLTTIDLVTLYDNPDTSPGDPSRIGGVVAQLKGPWAVDLARSDPGYLPGKGSPGELAVPFASVAQGSDGSALKTDGTRYGFGYDLVAATSAAKMVNVTDGAADYASMVTDGCTVLYVGTATFKGDKSDASCYPPDRTGWPDVVDFRLCFRSPTTYVNCQSPDNDPARPFEGEEHQRGIALKDGTSVIAQITLHTDHPFWDSVIHDTPAHFDQLAARVVGQPANGPTPTVTLESTRGVDYTAVTDARGKALQWRYCVPPPTDVHPRFIGGMSFDPESVPHAIGGDPASGLRDLYDFATYDQSTQGHLGSDGLCFVRRNYPSPP